jgi:hypothetical protein
LHQDIQALSGVLIPHGVAYGSISWIGKSTIGIDEVEFGLVLDWVHLMALYFPVSLVMISHSSSDENIFTFCTNILIV